MRAVVAYRLLALNFDFAAAICDRCSFRTMSARSMSARCIYDATKEDSLLVRGSRIGNRRPAVVIQHLVLDQLGGAFQFLKTVKGGQTFLFLSEFSIDLTQDVVVLGGRW